jgi:hypothetical protein
MREIRSSGSEGGGTQLNGSSLPLSFTSAGVQYTPGQGRLLVSLSRELTGLVSLVQ